MRKVLVDTDVLIENLKGKEMIIEHITTLRNNGCTLYVCPISIAEIHAGLREGEEEKIGTLFRSMNCLSTDDRVGIKAGEYLRTFSKSHGVEIADAIVAATAHVYETSLFTLNKKHYPMQDIKKIP
jgi:predicted nucleic acid-binding protein